MENYTPKNPETNYSNNRDDRKHRTLPVITAIGIVIGALTAVNIGMDYLIDRERSTNLKAQSRIEKNVNSFGVKDGTSTLPSAPHPSEFYHDTSSSALKDSSK